MLGQPRNRFQVFISHSAQPRFVDRLAAQLAMRHEFVISEFESGAGESLPKKVMDHIASCEIFLVCLTPEAMKSPWVNQEIGFALGRGKPVIPVLIGAGRHDQPPGFLTGLEAIYVKADPKLLDVGIQKSLDRVEQLIQTECCSRVFHTYHDYRSWWMSIDEAQWLCGPDDVAYWATPHDTWTWIMAHDNPPGQVPYRTLIRGDSELDRATVALLRSHPRQEAVFGVNELSPNHEIAIFGDLCVETEWDRAFMAEINDLVSRSRGVGEDLIAWYLRHQDRHVRIDVRCSIDRANALSRRKYLDELIERHKTD